MIHTTHTTTTTITPSSGLSYQATGWECTCGTREISTPDPLTCAMLHLRHS